MSRSLCMGSINKEHARLLQQLTQRIGWNFTSEQVNMFLSVKGTWVGHWLEDELVSSAALFQYGQKLASLGIVMVDPNHRGKGLGKQVIQQCLDVAARTGSPVTLVATAEGYPLYKRLGFQTMGQIHRFERIQTENDVHPIEAKDILPVIVNDLEYLTMLDEIVIGANRKDVYRILLQNIDRAFKIRDTCGDLQGFGLALRKHNVLAVGPLMATSPDVARGLVEALASSWDGIVRIDVPGEQTWFMALLKEHGFQETMVSPVMMIHGDRLPGQREQLFGIADPALG